LSRSGELSGAVGQGAVDICITNNTAAHLETFVEKLLVWGVESGIGAHFEERIKF
jgi:hypothetical protein